jgi:hypothetical protein
MSTRSKFWIIGLVLVIAGLVVAKLIAITFINQPLMEFGVFIAGVTLALAGLGVIMMGIRKKVD